MRHGQQFGSTTSEIMQLFLEGPRTMPEALPPIYDDALKYVLPLP